MTSDASGGSGILDLLKRGPVLGDGGFVFLCEKRGHVKAGPWTPEICLENPDALLALHREFVRAGSNVCQAMTFYGSRDKLGAPAEETQAINRAACDIARKAASESAVPCLVAGGICQTPSFLSGKDDDTVRQIFTEQIDVFNENKVDFIIAEYFEHLREALIALRCIRDRAPDISVAVSLCIGPEGSLDGFTPGECAVQLVNNGAHIVGVNCHFGPDETLEALGMMKAALVTKEIWNGDDSLPFLMAQPLGYHTKDCGKQGFIGLPEFPFALEPRQCTRWDARRFARAAYDMGVRYIGGCCGIEAYHIRAMAEELEQEIGRLPPGADKSSAWGDSLREHTKPFVRLRAGKDHWSVIVPRDGRSQSSN